MSIVCFYITGAKDNSDTLSYAMDLAAKTEQNLQVVCALPDLTASYEHMQIDFGYGVGTPVPSHLVDEQTETAQKTENEFNTALKNSALSADKAMFEVRYGFIPHLVADATLLADMCVFPPQAGRSGHMYSEAFLHALTECDSPVILAGSTADTKSPVIVAWDGSEQAMRSIRSHLPLLKTASEVVIVHNPNKLKHILKSPRRAPGEFQKWLDDRNIKNRLVDITGSVGRELIDTASLLEASTIIAGAYGHSRLGEYLFGGVTRTLLHADVQPAIALCH